MIIEIYATILIVVFATILWREGAIRPFVWRAIIAGVVCVAVVAAVAVHHIIAAPIIGIAVAVYVWRWQDKYAN